MPSKFCNSCVYWVETFKYCVKHDKWYMEDWHGLDWCDQFIEIREYLDKYK